jgi:hypothetical protein
MYLMDNLKSLLPSVLFAVIILSACCGDKLCPEGVPVMQQQFSLVNFTQGQVDSMQIKEYRASTNFTSVLDSIGFRTYLWDTATLNYTVSFDSILRVADSSINFLVSFPSANLSYKITNITQQTITCSRCAGHTNYGTFLSGYHVNDSVYTFRYYSGGITIKR